MKTIIAGSRNFFCYDFVKNAILESNFEITEVVSGGANGVDRIGEIYAKNNNIPIKLFLANWIKYGKSAGPIRNLEMAKYADSLIAIWDGKSRGTKNMIECARKNNLKIFVKIL